MADRDRSRLLFSGPTIRIGAFRCPPNHPAWQKESTTERHLVVFPRVGVQITHAGHDPITADPNFVMFYNPGQVYRRALLSGRGDACEWFWISPDTLADAASRFDPAVRDTRRFPFTHGPSTAESYLRQRRIFHDVVSPGGPPDVLALEEAFMTVLDDVLAAAYEARGRRPARTSPKANLAHTRATERLKAVLAARTTDRLTLDELSDAVELSPFHLCRVFRRRTGLPIHRYLTRLRLREALEHLGEPDCSLSRVAMDLGFASHGHFTHAFGREFGLTPSEARARFSGRLLRTLSKIVEAPPKGLG